MIRTFLFKLVLLVTLIGIGDLLITLVMPINVVREISQLDALLAGNADVIFFGDSTITSVAPSDQNKDFISCDRPSGRRRGNQRLDRVGCFSCARDHDTHSRRS